MTEVADKAEKLKEQKRKLLAMLRRLEDVDGRGKVKKSVEEHKLNGTYRKDRHGSGPEFTPAPKPAPNAQQSARSQRKWIRTAADERAVREGCRFDERLAQHFVDFCRDHLKHSKGQWAGQPFELAPWQVDQIIYPIFGWVRPDGTRRFRRTYIEMPKKQGKSTLASAVGLYMLLADEEPGAEVYSAATDKDQARIVHNEAINMVEASAELKESTNINRTTGTISYAATKSYYRVISGTPKGKHGFSIHACVMDELHEWQGNGLWESLKYGGRARRQPLFFVITNAGDDMESVCRGQHDKAKAVNEGHIYDQTFFGLIYSTDDESARAEIEAVREGKTELTVAAKCNPGLGTLVSEEDLLSEIMDASQQPSELPNLLRLTYGVWNVAEQPWLVMNDWESCAESYTEDEMAGRDCYAGLDLAKTRDLTAFSLVFPPDDEEGDYRTLTHFWMPENAAKARTASVPYMQWAEDGWLTLTPGDTCDYEFVFAEIARLANKFNIVNMAYDPWNAEQITQRITEELGIPRVEFKQTINNFADPTGEYERLVIEGRLRHNDNPLLTWQAGHVQVKTDVNKNKRPVKRKHGDCRTIDGIVAGIMAFAMARSHNFSSSSFFHSGA